MNCSTGHYLMHIEGNKKEREVASLNVSMIQSVLALNNESSFADNNLEYLFKHK